VHVLLQWQLLLLLPCVLCEEQRQETPLCCTAHLQDFPYLWLKAHVQHPVSLVQDHVAHTPQVGVALLQVVDEAARCYATTTSTPPRSSCRCSCMPTPPTTMQLRALRLLLRPKALTSLSICCASSRVGARTSAMGPSPGRSGGCCRQCWIIGMLKLAVLPLPVSAQPRMSLPDRATGMPWAWIRGWRLILVLCNVC